MTPDAPSADITIRQLDLPAELDLVRPLWLALRDHHHGVVPEWGPVRGDEETWALRRTAYAGWVADEGAFCLVAQAGDPAAEDAGVPLLGYALVRLPGEGPTWARRGAGTVETLSVATEARGRGVGKALLDAVRARLSAAGVDRVELTAVAANADALRFYEREGFTPSFVALEARVRPAG
jgi:ribosomal protein S18 acetylase RimI-like enzyme